MINFRRPMLAASLLPSNIEHTDENILAAMQKLRYPVLATLKKDGIRAIKLNQLVSRTRKLIPNKSIQARAMKLPAGFDIELWNPELPYDKVESIVMSREHKDSDLIQFHVLDWINGSHCYEQRMGNIENWIIDNKPNTIAYSDVILDIYSDGGSFIEVGDAQILLYVFKKAESECGEGICFRTPNSPYKQGRSTLKEQYLVKLARFSRTELTIIGFKEQMENGNSEQRNAIGLMDRSSFGAMCEGKNTLGAFLCKDESGNTVDVGTGVGLTDKLRKEIWMNRDCYCGRQITVKFKSHGMKDKLRHPIFVGFREKGF